MIAFERVTKVYPNGTEALNDLTLQVQDGEFVFLVGPSGAGKSTILNLLTGEERPTSGSLSVNGFSIESIRRNQVPMLRRNLGVVFQDFRLIENKTVFENLAFVMRAVGAVPQYIRSRVPEVLGLVGLSGKENVYPNELSGGEQQRVAIARALVNWPDTVIADEPTGNLDPDRSLEIMSLLETINTFGTTMLVVTHEQGLVNRFQKRVVHIENGRMIADVPAGGYQP